MTTTLTTTEEEMMKQHVLAKGGPMPAASMNPGKLYRTRRNLGLFKVSNGAVYQFAEGDIVLYCGAQANKLLVITAVGEVCWFADSSFLQRWNSEYFEEIQKQ